MKTTSALLLLLPLALAGCGNPYQYPGTWHATGVNAANLAVMVVNKGDLVSGQGRPGSDAVLDDAAITRLYTDKVKPLATESTTSTGGSGGSGQ